MTLDEIESKIDYYLSKGEDSPLLERQEYYFRCAETYIKYYRAQIERMTT